MKHTCTCDEEGVFRFPYLAVGRYAVDVEAPETRDQNNVVFRGPTPGTFSRIYDFTRTQSFREDVGLMFIELTQPIGKSFRDVLNYADRNEINLICIAAHGAGFGMRALSGSKRRSSFASGTVSGARYTAA